MTADPTTRNTPADPGAANRLYREVLVYSGKLVSGLFGGGLGSMVVGAWGYNGAYALAGGVSMVAAAIALLLRQPGRDRTERTELTATTARTQPTS